MRLPLYTLFLSFSTLFSLVHSIHPYALSRHDHRQSPPPNALTSRQHRVARDLLDICINANVDLAADLSHLLGSVLDPTNAAANIQLCLCLKDLNLYLETNDDIQALVSLLGKDAVAALITALINTSPDSRQCTFPSHAHHTCNNSDPCHYECDANYVLEGDQCVCAPPNISCNGVCGSFPQGCGSSAPLKRRTEPIRTLAQAKATCKPHETVCGIPGVRGFAFECIDVSRTKDSCGGCVVPHPFPDSERDIQPLGKDCGNIPNVRSVTCSASQCVVQSCQDGWLPRTTKDKCVASNGPEMYHLRSRALPQAVNATANTNIDSGLVSQLVAIVDNVLGLGVPPQAAAPSSTVSSPSSSSTFSTTSAIYSLFDDVRRATSNLLVSSTVSEFLVNTQKLVDTTALLNSMLDGCGCAQKLGLADSSGLLSNLITSLSSMQNWCAHNPIVPGSNVPSSGASNQPIVIGLTDLLSGLGLDGKSGAAVGGLGDGLSGSANHLLNSVDLGPNNYKRSDLADVNANSTIDSTLLANIIALVDIVIDLRSEAATLPISSATSILPQPSDPTSTLTVNGLVNSILVALGNILNSSTSSSLVSAVDGLVQTVEGANTLLDQSGCVDTLGLGPLVADLEQIITAALGVQKFCHGHPIVSSPPSTSSPASSPPTPSHSTSLPTSSTPANIADNPIVVGLSDLLTSLGLLGPVKAVVTVAGLGSGLNQPVDSLLNGLGIGPANARRGTDASTINLELRSLLEGLADLVINLEFSMSSLPVANSDSSSSSLNANSVLGVAHALGQLLQSKTVATLLVNIDTFIDAENDLERRFTGCACVEELHLEKASDLLQLIGEAAIGLKDWCATHSLVTPTPADPTPTLGPLLPTGGGPMAKPSESAAIPNIAIPTAHPASSPNPSASTPSTATGDIPIIIGLDHLLQALNLGTGIVAVDGLGNGLDSTVNTITNGLGIGPDGLRRRRRTTRRMWAKRQDLMKEREERRQINLNANTTVDSDLLVQLVALIDSVLGLNNAVSSLLPAPSSPSPPMPSPIANPPLAPSAPLLGSLLPIDSGIVGNILNAVTTLLSCGTYDELVSNVDDLVLASNQTLAALEGCGCIGDLGLGGLVAQVLHVVDAALGLQNYCHAHTAPPYGSPPFPGPPSIPVPTPTSSSTTSSNGTVIAGGDEPLVVGLTKLLNSLGLDIKADVITDLLGTNLDHTLNTLLNGLGIGPNGARRRSAKRVDMS
ncbi:hypothetical protein BDN70DRAFT_935626 [Pholiota conissans]|uniref:Protein CPL1-like domain-containing protein n=1 Tax=Pholiota conissans TaxID=109636 RepID=A0A9P6CQF0_9AGAR|nr:hypothetical protein BDN70DRAFT_935626 [Pholiota conissans]